MARKKYNSRHKSGGSVPSWAWLVAGLLLGVLVTSLVKFDKPAATREQPKNKVVSPQKNHDKPRFDFYTLLRESEVIVPEPPQPAPDDSGQPPAPTPEETKEVETLLLQVGSFKSASDADSLRARLLLLNLNARVETVTPKPGETWHRVLAGPFKSTRQLADARSTLAENGIDNILLKRR